MQNKQKKRYFDQSVRYVGHIIRRSQIKTSETRELICLNMSQQQEVNKGGTVERGTRGKQVRKLMVW